MGFYVLAGFSPKDSAYTGGVKCPDGVPVKFHQSCAGRCNYEPTDLLRGPLSTVPACKDTNVCVKEVGYPVGGKIAMNVCNGQFRCKDKGDLDWCKSSERKSEECPITDAQSVLLCTTTKCISNFRRCSGAIPGQCVINNLHGFHVSPLYKNIYFDCLDRSDLNPFPLAKKTQEPKSQQILEFDKIKVCKRLEKGGSWLISNPWLMFSEQNKTDQDKFAFPGLRCNEGNDGCLPRVFWCMGRKRREDLEMSFGMPKGTTTCQLLEKINAAEDSELCGNYPFWSSGVRYPGFLIE